MAIEYADASRTGRGKRGAGKRKITIRGITTETSKSAELIAREIITDRAIRKGSK